MADLVSASELVAYLEGGIDSTLADTLVAAAESQFEHECGRVKSPFQAAASGRVETHTGTGLSDLWLDYPVATLTSVKIGVDPADPDETLDVSDADVVRVDPRFPNRLIRTDGEAFGQAGVPLMVQVTYDTADDLPLDAKQAVLLYAAALAANKGNEGIKSESLGGYSVAYGLVDGSKIPVWQSAVDAHRLAVL